jgi:Cu+-exporting ATPase
MKHTLKLFAIAAGLTFGYSQASFAQEAAKTEQSSVKPEVKKGKDIVLNIRGMHCDDCKAKVEKELTKVKGVNTASASYIIGNVTVNADKKVKEKELIAAIKKAGFDAELAAPATGE